MIEQDDIEDLEEAQEKLKESGLEDEYISNILGSLVDSNPSISKISTSSDVRVTQESETVEIEVQESILQTDEGTEAVAHICENSEATKKAITSTLVLVEDKGRASQEEIKNFSEYSDTTEISRASKELKEMDIIETDSSGEVDVLTLTEDWIENLIRGPELKKKHQEILEDL